MDKIQKEEQYISKEEILVDLQNLEKNLESKTHISKPKQLAVLKVFAELLESRKMTRESNLLESFILVFLKYMVSADRLARKEIISAVSELRDKDRTNAQKLVMDLK